MRTLKIFYILGSIILLSLLVWQISEAASYPPDIQQQIEWVDTPMTCEKETPRKVGIIAYRESYANWLIRIFTKDGGGLEIWFDESISIPLNPFALLLPDKIYYYENGQWLDRNAVSDEEAQRLDIRLKFTGKEKRFFKECLEKQFMKQMENRKQQ